MQQTVQAGVNGQVSEMTKKGEASAYLNFFSQDVGQDCSPTPLRWKMKVTSATDNAFTAGSLRSDLTLSAMDNYYSTYNGYDPFVYATDALSPTLIAKPGG
jgi:hypothetical protein